MNAVNEMWLLVLTSFFRRTISDLWMGGHDEAKGWSVQGFGMLRYHFSDEVRLNIWDERYRVKDVSEIHDHPWNFQSVIALGKLTNVLYKCDPSAQSTNMNMVKIHPGPNGGVVSAIQKARVEELATTVYEEGDEYGALYYEVHKSVPQDLSVTLNKRMRIGEDMACVFFTTPEFVAAKPRAATCREVITTLEAVIKKHSL